MSSDEWLYKIGIVVCYRWNKLRREYGMCPAREETGFVRYQIPFNFHYAEITATIFCWMLPRIRIRFAMNWYEREIVVICWFDDVHVWRLVARVTQWSKFEMINQVQKSNVASPLLELCRSLQPASRYDVIKRPFGWLFLGNETFKPCWSSVIFLFI